jgi:pyridoxine 5-phosphate synthase|tara:strand:+ start:2248 stop:3015 length:768 start_codon:yes stop_codon:yes gene_type:complete
LNKSLSVNLNKIALIRNSREGDYPNILAHANICISSGADGITVHPRPDLRHIKPQDVYDLSALISKLKDLTKKSIELNIEGNPFAVKRGGFPGFIELIDAAQPDQCTLVPDIDSQLTSDHGFDLNLASDKLYPVINHLKSLGIRVSLFMEPDINQVKLASELGAECIELFTGPYATAWGTEELNGVFERYLESAQFAHKLGLGVNAGHDLNLKNLAKFCTIPELQEVSIGHALIVDAIAMGLEKAVLSYKNILAT